MSRPVRLIHPRWPLYVIPRGDSKFMLGATSIEAEDTGVMSLRLRSGALASINVTMLTHGKNFEGSITLLGERGTVRVGGVAVNKIEHWEFDTPHEDDARVAQASYGVESVYGPGHPLYYDNVIRSLRGEAEQETDGREGLRSLELLIATYLSARDARRVALPARQREVLTGRRRMFPRAERPGVNTDKNAASTYLLASQ